MSCDLEEANLSYLTHPYSDHKRQPMPGGGLFSTAGDVARFRQMILGGGVLPRQSAPLRKRRA